MICFAFVKKANGNNRESLTHLRQHSYWRLRERYQSWRWLWWPLCLHYTVWPHSQLCIGFLLGKPRGPSQHLVSSSLYSQSLHWCLHRNCWTCSGMQSEFGCRQRIPLEVQGFIINFITAMIYLVVKGYRLTGVQI